MNSRILCLLVLCPFFTVETFGAAVYGDCWTTGCQPNSWAVVGCQQYERTEKSKSRCPGGYVYECCPVRTEYQEPNRQPTTHSGGSKSTRKYCGYKLKTSSGVQTFSLLNHLYDRKDLTYRIDDYTQQMSVSDIDYIIEQAFNAWTDVTDLTFTKTNSRSADIILRFVVGDHGDGYPFDGPGNVLAHASYGFVHFDDTEHWSRSSQRGVTNLYAVAVHEIGHVLGLDHSDIKRAIMFAFYDDSNVVKELHSDDITGIQQLYGAKTAGGNDNSVDGGADDAGDCWTTGCQPNAWAVVGCEQYDRTERSKSACSGGYMYECCSGQTKNKKPNRQPTTRSECWSTGCQLSSWAVVGCQQYGMQQVDKFKCSGGHIYKCCK